MADALAASTVLAIFLILSWAAKRFVTDVAPHLVSKTRSSPDDKLLNAIKGPIQILIIGAGVYLACKTLNDISPGIVSILDKLAGTALILICASAKSKIMNSLLLSGSPFSISE